MSMLSFKEGKLVLKNMVVSGVLPRSPLRMNLLFPTAVNVAENGSQISAHFEKYVS